MLRKMCFVVLFVFGLTITNLTAQSTNASITGRITDQSKATIRGARVLATNVDTGVQQSVATGSEGMYNIDALVPGNYKLEVEKTGFRTIIKPDVILHIQDVATINFTMALGAVSESITVEGGVPLMNTTDASVSTVVDRHFAETLPMNGRSFQALIELTPGVVLTPLNSEDSGQFSVNGQRPVSNYWMIDGVSASFGVSPYEVPGNGSGGAIPSSSTVGGTNSLVSVDALQEFRIMTSTYAPEFGRTPGGQISIMTRSGTNAFHGTGFDYLRNDILDSNNWFNGYTNTPPLPKAQERQNDFGGTLGGPILKDRSFFFFSYEGLRLRLPQVGLTTVPDLLARQSAPPAIQPFLNAYPVPNGPDFGNGIAQFNASFSNKATLDAYSLRIDHRLTNKINLFGRYNYSPSSLVQRGNSTGVNSPLNDVGLIDINTQTATVGGTWVISPAILNDIRFNISRADAANRSYLDSFGAATPVAAPFPTPFRSQDSLFVFNVSSLSNGQYAVGKDGHNLQRQLNIVDNLSVRIGSHSLKFGVDYRRLSPLFDAYKYSQYADFNDVPSAEAGNLAFSYQTDTINAVLLMHNLGVFAQDTWRANQRLTLTYGLRWDVDFAPKSISGPSFPALTGFDLANLSHLALARPGTPAFNTTYGNIGPRVGIAYQVHQSQNWQTVLRGGAGLFYDLATSEVGNSILNVYPFGAAKFFAGGLFPLDSATAEPPPISTAGRPTIYAMDPNLKLPYTIQWNAASEQSLGQQQSISISYIGSVGQRLLQTAYAVAPTPDFKYASIVANTATSNYNAAQVQLRRQLSRGLQAIASYTWSHSIDDASAGSIGNESNNLVPSINSSANRGPSDFDIRNAFSAALTYDIQGPRRHTFVSNLLREWSVQNIFQARSSPPVDLYDSVFFMLSGGLANVRPDVVSGRPYYLSGQQYPGGKAFNSAAFAPPPSDPNTGSPLRQGDVPRNFLRGFGATQWDFAVHRDFPIRESLKLQFRAEMFNILNHPNFGLPLGDVSNPKFGQATQMLGQSLSGGQVGNGALSSLYQIGGPRSVQFALKLHF
jgi:carboxypeptidase family protein/TonB-dependent receptor-like protein